jgi:dephospho-CoA kinase
MVAALNDDSSDLGKVHFAFVHFLDLSGLENIPATGRLKREKSINQLRWVPVKNLGAEFERYEYWSKLCIKTLFGKQTSIPCKVHPVKNFSLRKHSKNIVIVGGIGSGKTEACSLLQRKFGYHLISSGRIMHDILKTSISEIGRHRFQDLAFSYIKHPEGLRELASAICSNITENRRKRNVIDGIRNRETFDQLREMLGGDLTLIYVDSTVDNAFNFFRQREGRGTSFDEFLQLVEHPVERDVDQFIKTSNVMIYNHGDKRSYLETAENYFRSELG